MKIFANYLPQFYKNKENDEFWGEGFTDWISCMNAKPLFKGHTQPHVPLNNNYYSLDNIDTIKWQVDLAKQYGIDGFAIYHYWFHDGLNLLTTPPSIIRDNKEIQIQYFFIWDNNSWKRTWSALTGSSGWNSTKPEKENIILAELKYGGKEEWNAHFDYLLPFFRDDRYLKINNKPVFCLFRTYKNYEVICEMVEYWNNLALDNGFNGVEVYSRADYKQKQLKRSFVYTPFAPTNIPDYIYLKSRTILQKEKVKFFDYDKMWKDIINSSKHLKKSSALSGFVNFDDTPRRGSNGKVVLGASPENFTNYFSELLKLANDRNNEFVLLTAWNEWGEGCYLEPDEEKGYAYLEAVRKARLLAGV